MAKGAWVANFGRGRPGFAYENMMEMEEDFVDKMSYCAQKYSRPLRNCMVTPQQHKSLFQNIEKLVAISEFHSKRLQEALCRCRREGESGCGAVYLPQLSLMAEAYSVYCGGLHAAQSLLQGLMKNQEFRRFVNSSKNTLENTSISEFLELPVRHIHALKSLKQNGADLTTNEEDQYCSLKVVASFIEIRSTNYISTIDSESVDSGLGTGSVRGNSLVVSYQSSLPASRFTKDSFTKEYRKTNKRRQNTAQWCSPAQQHTVQEQTQI